MVVLKKVLFLLVLLQLVNCGSSAVLLTEKPLSNYKVVILSPMAKDEFNIAPHILKRFKELGFRVLVEAPLNSNNIEISQLNIKYEDGWDLSRYVKSIQIQLSDYKTKELLFTADYYSSALTSTETAVNRLFSKVYPYFR